MHTKPILLAHSLFLFLVILSGSEGFSQNVGIGTVTPAYRLDVNGVINSTSEYRFSGKTIFRWGNLTLGLYRNFSAGDSAGFSNTTGIHNTFIGGGAGVSNMDGTGNCFVGTKAGYNNISGSSNTFIGSEAGRISTSTSNTFVGHHSGYNTNNGYNNVFIGSGAGFSNTSGDQNTFIGLAAGDFNQSGVDNVFIGLSAGQANTTGSFNTLIGNFSNLGSTSLINASAIGFHAYVTQSNSLVLGSINGVNGSGADTRVGIGTTAPTERLDIVGNIKVSGEVNHPSTGASNLLPIAFGSISSAGAINTGSENFAVSRTAAGSYTIDINNHSYTLSTYATVVTVVGSTPLVAMTSSGSGNLFVRLYNLSGVLTDGTFHFVVHKQ